MKIATVLSALRKCYERHHYDYHTLTPLGRRHFAADLARIRKKADHFEAYVLRRVEQLEARAQWWRSDIKPDPSYAPATVHCCGKDWVTSPHGGSFTCPLCGCGKVLGPRLEVVK